MSKIQTAFNEYQKQKAKVGYVYEHQFGCPNIESSFPIDECNCDCYVFAIFRGGYQALEKRFNQLQANNKDLTLRNATLRRRPDLPADRIPATTAYEKKISELEKDAGDMQTHFNEAIDYAIEGRDQHGHGYTDQESMDFLRMWREGDWAGIKQEFPTFKSELMK